MAGTTWIALQPVPTTATRLPARSTSWRHRAVWKAGPSKLSSPAKRRHRGHRELPARRDQDLGLVRSGAGLQDPPVALIVPAGALYLRARADPVQHPVASRDALEVGLDLGLGREAARPVRVRLEGELVEVGRDVAGGAGIRVVVPHTADPLRPLEHRDVVIAGAVKHHHRADPAEAAADHGDRGRPTPPAIASVRRRDGSHGEETTPRRRAAARPAPEALPRAPRCNRRVARRTLRAPPSGHRFPPPRPRRRAAWPRQIAASTTPRSESTLSSSQFGIEAKGELGGAM